MPLTPRGADSSADDFNSQKGSHCAGLADLAMPTSSYPTASASPTPVARLPVVSLSLPPPRPPPPLLPPLLRLTCTSPMKLGLGTMCEPPSHQPPMPKALARLMKEPRLTSSSSTKRGTCSEGGAYTGADTGAGKAGGWVVGAGG